MISWTEQLEDFTGRNADGPFPVLKPSDPERAARWSKVLSWYESQALETPVLPRATRDDWVVGVGNVVSPVSRILAERLGRSHDVLDRITAFKAWTTCHRPNSVMLVVEHKSLDFAQMTLLMRIVDEASPMQFGVLTGADLPGISFAAAKVCYGLQGGEPGDLGLDPIFGKMYENGQAGDLELDPMLNALKQDFRTLFMLAHGEGAHLFLEHAVLCGLIGDRELDWLGREVRGCGPSRCKRGGHFPVQTVKTLRVKLIAFLSCNSFSVTGQMYPSNTSLVLSAAESYPAFSISNPWSVSFEADEIPMFLDMVRAGVSLGRLLNFMNRSKFKREQYGSCVLFGDPLAATRPDGQAIADLPRWDERYQFFPSDKLVLSLGPESASSQLYRCGDWVLVKQETTGTNPTLVDRTQNLQNMEAWLGSIAKRLQQLPSFEHCIEMGLTAEEERDETLMACMSQLREQRLAIERLTVQGYELCSQIRGSGIWSASLGSIYSQLRECVLIWDAAMALLVKDYLLKGGVVGDRIFNVLHSSHREGSCGRGPLCEKCGAPTLEIEMVPFVAGPERLIRECPLCGPLCERMVGGDLLELHLPQSLAPGEETIMNLTLRRPPGDQPREGYILFEIRDKTRPSNFFSMDKATAFENGSLEIRFKTPSDAGFDQFSARAIWVSELEVVYARRVAVLTNDPRVM